MLIPLLWGIGFFISFAWFGTASPVMQSVFLKNIITVTISISLFFACLVLISQKLSGNVAFTRAFKFLAFSFGFFVLIIVDISRFSAAKFDLNQFLLTLIPSYIMSIFIASGIILSHEYLKIQKVLLLLTLIVFLLDLHSPLFIAHYRIIYVFCTLVALTSMALFFASQKKRFLFQLCLLLLGLRFFAFYLLTLKDFAQTGIGLIIGGLLLLGCVLLWHKYRGKLFVRIERWLS